MFRLVRHVRHMNSPLYPVKEFRHVAHPIGAHVSNSNGAHRSRGQGYRSHQSKPFDAPAYLRRLLARGDGAGEAELWELSPVRLDWEPGAADAITILRTLYHPEDKLFIGECEGVCVATVADWITRINAHGALWPHIIPNPLTGLEGTTKAGKPSWRADSCVQDFRYAVVEFDTLPRPEQIAFWYAVITGKLLNVATLIDSGGKSIHGWCRVNCTDATAWERDVEQDLFVKWLVPLGVDPQCRNEARLSRLPGHLRADKEKIQRLLYLDRGLAIQA